MQAQIKQHRYALTPIAKTFLYPFGFHSTKIFRLSQLESSTIIAFQTM